MDEIVQGLWIGDMASAMDTEILKANNIFSILSAMRGRITINETFNRHQILLDDTEDEDILVHLLPSITFIQEELDKGRGVLVHCQAGMSRSAAIVAAYLMYTQHLNVEQALDIIRQYRPDTQPNDGFLNQLEVFYQASFKISRSNKPTRMYYLARTVEEILNGDGSLPSTSMFAKFPRTPSDSIPPTPSSMTPGPIVRRRIRCKMCRQELATREHMLDHGQLNPPTPAFPFGCSPAVSRRGSSSISPAAPERRPSLSQAGVAMTVAPSSPLASRSSSLTAGISGGAIVPSPLSVSATRISEMTLPTMPLSSSPAPMSTTSLSRSHSSTVPRTRSRVSSSSSSVTPTPPSASGSPRSRRQSNLSVGLSGVGEALSMSSIDGGKKASTSNSPRASRSYSAEGEKRPVVLSQTTKDAAAANGHAGNLEMSTVESALDSDDDDDDVVGEKVEDEEQELNSRQFSVEAAKLVGKRLSERIGTASGSSTTNGSANVSSSTEQASSGMLTPPGNRSAGETVTTSTPTQEILEPKHRTSVPSTSILSAGDTIVDTTTGEGSTPNPSVARSIDLSPMTTTTVSRAPFMDTNALASAEASVSGSISTASGSADAGVGGVGAIAPASVRSPPTYIHPHDLAAQLYSNQKLAALRSPGIGSGPGTSGSPGVLSDASGMLAAQSPVSLPIIANPKCSGYFVEPMKWMEPFLSDGQLAGKIICPNKKCNAKLGNYDWAGVCCSCKEWVTPGFCIARSKVDEVV